MATTSAMSGTSTPSMTSVRPGSFSSPQRPLTFPFSCRATMSTSRQARRRTTSPCIAPKAARSCSVPGACFGAGRLTTFTSTGPVGPNEYTPTDPNAEQAMVNLFAQMGVQPNSLAWYLTHAQKTTDIIAPDSHVAGIFNNQRVLAGSTITFSGTATDSGGGVVAAVEISTDGGLTWKPTIEDGNWSYNWIVPNEARSGVDPHACDRRLAERRTSQMKPSF